MFIKQKLDTVKPNNFVTKITPKTFLSVKKHQIMIKAQQIKQTISNPQ